MSKENVQVSGEVISNQQRSRISQNFRAVKPLLDRKRPFCATDFHYQFPHKTRDVSEIESPGQVSSNKRAALSEIPINTPPPYSINGGYSSISCSNYTSVHRMELSKDVEKAHASVVSTNREFLSNPFITPVKQPEFCNSNDHFLMTTQLDDEFDESILQEIDAICEMSASKAREERLSSSSCDENRYDGANSSDIKSGSEFVLGTESIKREVRSELFGNHMKFEKEEADTSQLVESGSMPDKYLNYLQSLNERQHEAACCNVSTPLMIVAGPGSGKTSTMVGRVLFLLKEGISPSNILAMTFTTAAASEMRDRISSVAGKATAKEITISTFHSFSLKLCRSHAEKLERTSEFLLYGHGQQRRAIIEAVRLLEKERSLPDSETCKLGEDFDGKSAEHFKDKSKKWQKFVTQAKASGRTPGECLKMGDETGAAVIKYYDEILRSCNALDYHDLISCSAKLLSNFPEVLKECQDLWKAIIVDEFQDTSAMQYNLLRILASHNQITIVGDDDQSIFSFNGADISGFNSFRRDFPSYKEIRLSRNYRSTGCIVEAASSLIKHNIKRCQSKNVLTDNTFGSKITVKECHNDEAQCAFVVDKILECASNNSADKCSFGSIAILYRRQVSGKVFQMAFRERRIPFNIHGVAFYRKKVVKAIVALLRTALPGCDDGPYRQVFKVLLPLEKDEKNKIIDHVDKICTIRKINFISAACDIFNAKISGTFKRSQITQGRKVLSTLEMISKLVHREQSISTVVTSVANLVPQKYLLERRAVVDFDGVKLLNEDNDVRSVLQYLLDDVSDFLSTKFTDTKETNVNEDKIGCVNVIKSFIDYLSDRERENFRARRYENENSVTLTTIHQSKGLEWDIVFIVKTNEGEIPLLHDFNGVASEKGTSVEEERRLLYVAMTRARKKLFILYVSMDSSWQLLLPSRFLREIPHHLLDIQADLYVKDQQTNHQSVNKETLPVSFQLQKGGQLSDTDLVKDDLVKVQFDDATEDAPEIVDAWDGNSLLRRFSVDDRGIVSHLFHQWARKKAFQDPKRLLSKVGFVIDERLRVKKNKQKDVLRELKSCLASKEACHYAEHVLRWEQIPADKRAHLLREKQEHFQKLRIEKSMGSAAPTSKQIAFLKSLGCTVDPTSRLHASRLIEQYKSL